MVNIVILFLILFLLAAHSVFLIDLVKIDSDYKRFLHNLKPDTALKTFANHLNIETSNCS